MNWVTSRIFGGNTSSGPGGGGGGDVTDILFDATHPITRDTPGIDGVNLGTSTVKTTLQALLFPAVAPGASISVNNPIREIGASGAYTLSWTATENTNPITGITVDGVAETPTGSTQSGTQSGTVSPINAEGIFTKAMSDTDGTLTGNASCSIQYMPRMFWGTNASNGSPSDATILALANSSLATGFALNLTNFGGGGLYLVFAWPSSFGSPQFIVNGLNNTAFTKVRSASNFVNGQGATVVMDVWTSNNLYNSPLGTVIVQA
jgi:hypothetical protein